MSSVVQRFGIENGDELLPVNSDNTDGLHGLQKHSTVAE